SLVCESSHRRCLEELSMKRSLVVLAVLGFAAWSTGLGQAPDKPSQAKKDETPPKGDERSAEEERERQVMDRFLTVLEKNPRRGTALDRVYGYHVERGTLPQLIKRFTDRASKNAADGAAWMLLGLVESQRGKDAAAVAAFEHAEKHLPDNPIASYYLGQSLVLVGRPEAAADA